MYKGVTRIIEALVASLMIIAAFSISYYFITPPAVSHQRTNEALVKLGYNIFSTLSDNNGFDELVYDKNGMLRNDWMQQLKVVMNTLVPNNVIFEINVYNATFSKTKSFIVLEKLNNSTISNADSEAFLKSGETAQITYIYTTKFLKTIVIELRLAYTGGM